ncbi:MAG TPA: hypothetical protein DCZ95_19765 [Verrucomicrobia bacterium]|nr:MAG: hypothetical protein A2X46_10995 [Lentisphaerae bacterium GWF2_57_35]HBA86324.1 hypothetical protein [Verrucomicrobiota bacterium]
MTRTRKVLLSAFLTLISFSCFIYMPPSLSQTVTKSIAVSSIEQHTEELTTEASGVSKLLEWIGIGAIVLAAWLWRAEFGVTQLGPLGGPELVIQQKAGAPSKPSEESGPPRIVDLARVSAEMNDAEAKHRLDHIMQMFQKVHSISASYVARDLGVTTDTARTYLYSLVKAGQLRADGFPKHTIYTPAKSLENRILDVARQKLSQTHGVLSERRYVRIGKMHDIDAILESEDITFIVEAKILRSADLISRLDSWVLQMLNVAKDLHAEKIACVLAVACLDEATADTVKKQASGFTFDSGSVPVEIMVFSESDLPS